MSTKETLVSANPDLRIVLIGRVGAGKTAVMNTILRSSEDSETLASVALTGLFSDTEKCQEEKVKIGRQNLVIVDTPGLCHTEHNDNAVMDEIKRGVALVAPGPHVFLFVMDLERFTQEGEKMVEFIWNTFGQNAAQYTMVLFTHGNELKKRKKPIEVFIEENEGLKNFILKCNGGYHVIENNNQDPSEVTELLDHINAMVNSNGGNAYSWETLGVAEKRSGLRKKIALSVNGSALAGAGVGAAMAYFAGSPLGIPAGAAAGAAVGGVIGGVGVVASQYITAKTCATQ